MPNLCSYDARIVAKSKETVQRVIDIMNYRDPEYFLHRVFECDNAEEPGQTADGYWYVDVYGDTAWNAQHLVDDPDQPEAVLDDGKDGGSAHRTGFETLCKTLDFGVEIWSKEPGCCFQEHLLVDHTGCARIEDAEEWHEDWTDDDGNELDEPVESGGFADYLQFRESDRVYLSDDELPIGRA